MKGRILLNMIFPAFIKNILINITVINLRLTANYYPLDVSFENKFRFKLKNWVSLTILPKFKTNLSSILEEKL